MGFAMDSARQWIRERGARYTDDVSLLLVVVGDANFTYDVACKLLDQAGGLVGLQAMSLAELQEFPGVGEAAAIRLQSAFELGRRVWKGNFSEQPQVRSPSDIAQLMMDDLQLLDQEQLWVILLNTKNRVIARRMVYQGSVNTTLVRVAEVLRPAIREQAAAFVVVHNHPSGDPVPSPEDVQLTEMIVRAGTLLDINCLDHVIIGRQSYVSLKERGLGF